jgi:predicted dehydrogenase
MPLKIYNRVPVEILPQAADRLAVPESWLMTENPMWTPEHAVPAPDLPYAPRDPKKYQPGIGLIGCGAIANHHLKAYRSARYRVVALCDRELERAEDKRELFCPEANVFDDYHALLARADIEVVDVATHVDVRSQIVEAALRAGKHVLSQKPLALSLEEGKRLADLADELGVRLAVNQNARWAPHFSYLRQAVAAGLLGEVDSADFLVHWDHNWVVGTEFDDLPHLILCDFAIHWFDLATQLFAGRRAQRVFAAVQKSSSQKSKQPLLAQALVEWEGGLSTFSFHGDQRHLPQDRTRVAGSHAHLLSEGPTSQEQSVTLRTSEGRASPRLIGAWFPDGFHGAMAELLCAIEEKRAPEHSARQNLRSLEICFAACASSLEGRARVPGEVRELPR